MTWAKGGAGAVRGLYEAGIPDLICHHHFLAAVGTQLFDKLHRRLLSMIRTSCLLAELRALLADLQRYGTRRDGRFGPGRIREELSALVFWVIEGDGKKTTVLSLQSVPAVPGGTEHVVG